MEDAAGSSAGKWREGVTDGGVYYYREDTGESQWEIPADSDLILPPPPPPEPTTKQPPALPPAMPFMAPPYVPPPGGPYTPPAAGPYAPYGGMPYQPYGMPQQQQYDGQYAAQYGMPQQQQYGAPYAPKMEPPPSLPSLPDPYREPAPLPPQPEQEFYYRREDNWPGKAYHKHVGMAIHRCQETPGNVRHDIIIEKRVIGRLLGKGARDLDALKAYSGCEVFIIDKHPPPGEGEDHRLLILIGNPTQMRACKDKVDAVLDRARQELPPLPPPLSSGLRPVPEYGDTDRWRAIEPPSKRQR